MDNVDEEYDRFVHHLRDSAKGAESLKTTKRRLSRETLELIRQRGAARASGNYQLTSELAKLCRATIKEDLKERRAEVLDEPPNEKRIGSLIQSEIKQLRRREEELYESRAQLGLPTLENDNPVRPHAQITGRESDDTACKQQAFLCGRVLCSGLSKENRANRAVDHEYCGTVPMLPTDASSAAADCGRPVASGSRAKLATIAQCSLARSEELLSVGKYAVDHQSSYSQ
ncbi:unnamed protein product [Heligmosomoides polygyrus]|uniref:Syntaxin-18_N domain-containing protein n=1 Tax=Heligmosomoides polygyrus TaxID=6339 RepID=A0A183GPH4_HELPZ|nr:unnamed protein product [Heligmosomoides polygyrus]